MRSKPKKMEDIKNLSKTLYEKGKEGLDSRLLIAFNEIDSGGRVLEVGLGRGELTASIGKLKTDVELYGVDVAEKALERLRNYLTDFQLADISCEKLKFEDNYFDTVICLEVFEHLQNPYHALVELQRVLVPGGKLIISVPNYLGGHLMIYPGLITPKFFARFLRQNFFKINRFIPWGPVFNKDNVGRLMDSKCKNKFIGRFLLRGCQVTIRFLQMVTKVFGFKVASLYWCHFFICENRKNDTDSEFWIKQLNQASDFGQDLGWYDPSFHKKA